MTFALVLRKNSRVRCGCFYFWGRRDHKNCEKITRDDPANGFDEDVLMRTFFSSLAIVVLTVLILPRSAEAAYHYGHSAVLKANGAMAHSRLRSGSDWSPQQDDVVQDGW